MKSRSLNVLTTEQPARLQAHESRLFYSWLFLSFQNHTCTVKCSSVLNEWQKLLLSSRPWDKGGWGSRQRKLEQSWERRSQQRVVAPLKENPYNRGWQMNCRRRDLKRCKGKEAGNITECLQVGKGQFIWSSVRWPAGTTVEKGEMSKGQAEEVSWTHEFWTFGDTHTKWLKGS